MKFGINKKQRGFTLLEVLTVLVLGGLIVGGALSLFGGASSQQASNQLSSDITALRGAVKGLYSRNGGYGTANLNQVLVNANKVPGTMAVTAGTPPTISHTLGGTVTTVGTGTTFTIAASAIPTDVCVALVSTTNGWTSVQVGTATAITAFPISPDTASGQCAAAATQTLTFTSA